MRALIATGNQSGPGQTPLEIREVDEPAADASQSIVDVLSTIDLYTQKRFCDPQCT